MGSNESVTDPGAYNMTGARVLRTQRTLVGNQTAEQKLLLLGTLRMPSGPHPFPVRGRRAAHLLRQLLS